jgi:hypothetical protein
LSCKKTYTNQHKKISKMEQNEIKEQHKQTLKKKTNKNEKKNYKK